jgi:hypothetical protein
VARKILSGRREWIFVLLQDLFNQLRALKKIGTWCERAAKIYGSVSQRLNVAWKTGWGKENEGEGEGGGREWGRGSLRTGLPTTSQVERKNGWKNSDSDRNDCI